MNIFKIDEDGKLIYTPVDTGTERVLPDIELICSLNNIRLNIINGIIRDNEELLMKNEELKEENKKLEKEIDRLKADKNKLYRKNEICNEIIKGLSLAGLREVVTLDEFVSITIGKLASEGLDGKVAYKEDK